MDSNTGETFTCREKRYQWIINVLLVIMGFFGGILFEAERMKAQVVSNTVEIRMIRDTLDDIQYKLDTLINERRMEVRSPAFLAETPPAH